MMYKLRCASCRSKLVDEWMVRSGDRYRCDNCGKLNKAEFNQDFFAHYEAVIVEEKDEAKSS